LGKLYSPPGTTRRQSLRGSHYVYESKAGTIIANWPPKRPGEKSEAQLHSMKLFKEACEALKRMSAGQQNYARENAKGTPFLPRDALMACLYGNGPVIGLRTGAKLRPMAVRVNTSLLFDNIAWEPGSMLFRGADFWEGIPPGNNGQVLTYTDANHAPTWQAGSSGSGIVVSQIKRTTNQAASSVWPRYLEFQQAINDPLNVWNPAEPTKIFLPQNKSLVRVTWSSIFVGTGQFLSTLSVLEEGSGNSDWPGNIRCVNAFDSYAFANRWVAGASGWFDPTFTPWVRIYTRASQAYNGGMTNSAWFTVEAI